MAGKYVNHPRAVDSHPGGKSRQSVIIEIAQISGDIWPSMESGTRYIKQLPKYKLSLGASS